MLTTSYALPKSVAGVYVTFCLCASSLFLLPQAVFAHAKSTSYSTWEIEGNHVQVTVRVSVIELQRSLSSFAFSLPALQHPDSDAERELTSYLTHHLRLFSGDQPCEPVLPSVRIMPSSEPSRITRTWTLVCPLSQQLWLRNDAFFAAAPAHLHFARVRIAGTPTIEKVFSVHEREWSFFRSENTAQETGGHFHDYLWLGITHILSGVDHLVFLFALLLMAESITSIVQIVTGFTVAHSLTLVLGVLNVVRPASTAIESLIGFSIVIVALENFWITSGDETRQWLFWFLALSLMSSITAARFGLLHVPLLALLGMGIFSISYLLLLRESMPQRRLRWFVAFTFGLVHGFGFAGALAEMALPANRLATALVGFNLGVELGQLGVVALVWPILMWLHQLQGSRPRRLTIQMGSAVLLAVGIFWFVTRAVDWPS